MFLSHQSSFIFHRSLPSHSLSTHPLTPSTVPHFQHIFSKWVVEVTTKRLLRFYHQERDIKSPRHEIHTQRLVNQPLQSTTNPQFRPNHHKSRKSHHILQKQSSKWVAAATTKTSTGPPASPHPPETPLSPFQAHGQLPFIIAKMTAIVSSSTTITTPSLNITTRIPQHQPRLGSRTLRKRRLERWRRWSLAKLQLLV